MQSIESRKNKIFKTFDKLRDIGIALTEENYNDNAERFYPYLLKVFSTIEEAIREYHISRGITSDKNEEVLVSTENDIKKAIETITSYVSSDRMDDNAKQIIRDVLSDYAMRLDLFMVAHTRSKIMRLQRLIDALDNVEENLYQPDRINSASTRDLLQIHFAITSSIKDVVNLVIQTRGLNVNPEYLITPISEQSVSDITNLSRTSRPKVASVLDQILNKARTINVAYTDVEDGK